MALRIRLALVALCLGAQGCRRTPSPPVEQDEVVPVFALDRDPVDPRAQRLCQALHEIPSRARVACGGSPETTLTELCASALSISLRSAAVTIEDARPLECERATSAALAGCPSVGANPFEPPAACRDLAVGKLGYGRRCRSSLECRPGTFCRGVGPTDFGVCAPPQPAGSLCSTGVDALAGYLRQQLEPSRPECQGFCQRNRCFDFLAVGGACQTHAQCGPAGRCAQQTCVADTVASHTQRMMP
jgi:hypothetical protein